ncbi:MAG TPA: amidohydrolase family protein [Acidimicrobiales bacterium]|nr:amidohydrolase family protein [Acidimicrobiales bacterium]
MGMHTVDVDQHLFESRDTWAEYIDPKWRQDALAIEDDEVGWAWLTWRGRRLSPIEVPFPENGAAIGEDRLRRLRGEPPAANFDDLVPPAYRDVPARLELLDDNGMDGAVLFPNYGLLWEKWLAEDRCAQRENARAYNRFMIDKCHEGGGRLFGVAHLQLHDPAWAVEEIRRVSEQGVRLAMVAPAPVDGKPLSHQDFDPVWRTFADCGVAPVFHVSGFESPIHPAWHMGETEDGGLFLDSIFLWLAPAIAVANLILSGTLERVPDLRLGVVELTAGWVPSFLLHMDGASDFFAQRHGGPLHPLPERPSTYFLRQVRVAALPYEMPNLLVPKVGEETFMVGSDWPHAEGVAHPQAAAERAAHGLEGRARSGLLGGNAAWLLGVAP